jgi:hypothetical protein
MCAVQWADQVVNRIDGVFDKRSLSWGNPENRVPDPQLGWQHDFLTRLVHPFDARQQQARSGAP